MSALGLAAALALPAFADVGVLVSGAAARDVTVWFDGACYWAKNHGQGRVRVHLGPWSAPLESGQSLKFVGTDGCFYSYQGATEAEYLD